MTYREYMREARREYIASLMHEAHGKVEAAAMMSGLSKRHIYAMMDEFSMPRRKYKEPSCASHYSLS